MTPPASGFLSARVVPLEAVTGRFAVLGISHGIPYSIANFGASVGSAPHAIRERSRRFGRMLTHHDFDLGRPLDADGTPPLVDCGDVAADPNDIRGSAARATAAVRQILGAGAMLKELGGDDSITALVIAAFAEHGPLSVLQIDAHIDYRDEVDGVRDGYSSPMRRAAEMEWVERIVHCGIRGVGSARAQDVRDTLSRGNRIFTARDVRARGVESVLAEFPVAGRYYIAFDCDGVDPSVMPGTSAPLPGGLSYDEAAGLLTGLAMRGTVAGVSFAEYYPSLDLNGITALAITRLIVNLLGVISGGRSGA
ncbi:MAG: arginase family protein [Gammaproteobacteria bacterium]|nr:arginase family protein [Gammaproteobacteria bacterium]